MTMYRESLPQSSGGLFLTDGGLETTLIFHEGIDLPEFAAFPLLRTEEGRALLKKYFRSYIAIAMQYGIDVLLETATWRASPDWAEKLGYDRAELAEVNRQSVKMLEELRGEVPVSLVISGCVGPRGDGYIPTSKMTEKQAADYHRDQIEAFAQANADLVTAITMNYVEEAVGIVEAARNAGMPVVISFTVETDGTLPSGESLSDAIEEVDAVTQQYPAYYMINCAHPDHFDEALRSGSSSWLDRIRGIRANASRMSHAQLNESPTLDIGDPEELGRQYADLLQKLPNLNVMGGCCGTDARHVGSIAKACSPLFARRSAGA